MPNGNEDVFCAIIRTSWGVSVFGTGYSADAALRKAVSRVPGLGTGRLGVRALLRSIERAGSSPAEWKITIAMGTGLQPTIVGLQFGMMYQPLALYRPFMEHRTQLAAQEVVSPLGWREL